MAKPGFSFFVLIFCYFCVFDILCFLVLLSYCYVMLSLPVQLIAWEDRPQNDLLCVERDVKQVQLLTHSLVLIVLMSV